MSSLTSGYTAIVPAAGASQRMGRPKLLLPFRQQPLIAATLTALTTGGCDRVVVVGRPGASELEAVVRSCRATWTENPEPERGMLSTILCGVARAARQPDLAALLICPADLPRLRGETVARLIRAHRAGQGPLLVPRCQRRRGHPLLIDPTLLDRLQDLDPKIGLRQLTRAPDLVLQTVEVDDDGCLRDVDTPADYESLGD